MKKALLFLITAVVSQYSFASTSLDLGNTTGFTPYDRYMSPVKQVLSHVAGQENSMDRVRQLMHTGRAFRYSFTDPYTAATPDVTSSIRAGDCKAKALWLCNQLNDESVRFVIGKARRNSRISHAWVMWQHDSRWFILDCTNMREPIAADRVSSSEYIPYYSFSKTAEFRHRATSTSVAENVASKNNSPVASHSGNR